MNPDLSSIPESSNRTRNSQELNSKNHAQVTHLFTWMRDAKPSRYSRESTALGATGVKIDGPPLRILKTDKLLIGQESYKTHNA